MTHVVKIIDSGASDPAAVGTLPLTVVVLVMITPRWFVTSRYWTRRSARRKPRWRLVQILRPTAALDGHAAHEEAAAAIAKRCPVFAESRRLITFDDSQESPYLGTKNDTLDSYEERSQLEVERESSVKSYVENAPPTPRSR